MAGRSEPLPVAAARPRLPPHGGTAAMPENDAFKDAQERVKTLARRPPNESLLELYGLYKQATEGDARGARPGVFDLKGRAKFDAWSACKGTPQAEARTRYVALVDKLAKTFG